MMKIEFDPEKNARNIELRGISFEEAAQFEWKSALITPDERSDYGDIQPQEILENQRSF